MPRLFVAARPPAHIREQVIALRDASPGARWQDDDQLHITLRFIGDMGEHGVGDVADALAGVHHYAFETELSGVGTFTRRERLSELWAGLSPRDPLKALHHKIDRALVRAGLLPEGRAYRPHLTLARFSRSGGDPSAFVAANAALTSAPFPVTHFDLYESDLATDRATYALVQRWALASAEP